MRRTICIILMMLVGLNVYAPYKKKSMAVRFYERVRGTESEKRSAYWGFLKWPNYFGHTRQEIWDLITRETASTFNVKAYNGRTQARGLTQVRFIALEDIEPPPDGKSFFIYRNISDTETVKMINRHVVYRPFYNIYAGCAYYALCKRRAEAQSIGKFKFTQEEMAKLYYVAGIGTWRNSFVSTLRYIQ